MRMFITKVAKKRINQLLAKRGYILSTLSTYGRSQADDLALLVQDLNLDRPEVVVDVGANQGDFSLKCHTLWPKARILAIEPHPRTFQTLSLRCASQAIHRWEGALSSSEGVMELLDHGDGEQSQMNSLASDVAVAETRFSEMAGCKPTARVPVKVSTLDTVVKNFNMNRIDILKIDVEGAEVSVLEGARQLLHKSLIGMIAVEWSARNAHNKGTNTLESIIACLNSYNYYLAASSIDWASSEPFYINNNAVFLPRQITHATEIATSA